MSTIDSPTETAISTFYLSAVTIGLTTESLKSIESIRLHKNDQSLVNIKKDIRAGNDPWKKNFTPPLSVSRKDRIFALINYSTKYRKQVELSIDISVPDDEKMREENGVRRYRKKVKHVEVFVTVHPNIPSLVSTTTTIIQACSRFRILIMGNTGVGKSSLINKVFGVPDVKPSENKRGEAEIEREFTSPTNERVVVHDSLGFEAGDEGNVQIVQAFVAKRKSMPDVKDQLHAIWLCLEIPFAGGRLLETGVENFLKNRKEILGDIPLVVVLTKVDVLDGYLEAELPEIKSLEDYKSKYMNDNCIKPLYEAAGEDVKYAVVSVRDDYLESLSTLLKATDEHMIKYGVGEAPRVMVAIAQRVDIRKKIELSIRIGKEKYWNMLLKSSAFRGHTLTECLQVIRKDITEAWNFHDPDQCLMDDGITRNLLRTGNLEGVTGTNVLPDETSSFQGLYNRIIESQDPVLSVLPAVLWIACPPLKAYEAYQEAKQEVKILMAYIVDLICLMQILIFLLAPGDCVTKQTAAFSVGVYERSRKEVHRLVEAFNGGQGVAPGGRDYVLEQIEEWIWLFSIKDEQIQELKEWFTTARQGLVASGSGSS